jgi:hypothetical protein
MPAADEAEDRLRAIASITDSRIEHLEVDDLLDELLVRVVALVEADTAAVLLSDPGSQQLVARATCGIEEEVRQGVRVPIGVGFAGRVAAERRPVVLDRVDATTVWNPILWQKGIRKMLGVPLQSGTELLGVLHVGRLTEIDFTPDDTALVELVATRIAAAIQGRLLAIERAAGEIVQRSLLPAAPPVVAGLEFATRFVPAERGGVGGDWYDAFVLESGALWVMVGDVAGHGLGAAVTMSRLRAVLRAYALEGHDPGAVLALADRKLQFFEPGQTATVLCALLHPPYDTVTFASAGHPPPVLVRPDGEAGYVQVPASALFGATDLDPEAVTVPLLPGSLFVAYSDGLIERRGESLEQGMGRLAAAVEAAAPELVCRRVMQELVGNDEPTDDIVVMAVRRTPS